MSDPAPLPYRIAVLCYLFDAAGRVLLIHRRRPPNRDRHSPIGGKLDQQRGESPQACAVRETREETGLELAPDQLHLTGLVSETGHEGEAHWLMFLYEALGPVSVTPQRIAEGALEWHPPAAVPDLAIPETDRRVIWPLFWRFRGSFFAAHVDCTGPELSWRLEQPVTEPDP